MNTENENAIIQSDGEIHNWFGLSYASHLVLPRSVLQSMPLEWQEKFVEMIKEISKELEVEDMPEYRVNAIDSTTKKFLKDHYAQYERGRRRIERKSKG